MANLFVKRLTNLDFSFLDAKRGLVGESWLLDIELSGKLDEQGMVLDFGIVKKLVRDYIDTHIDHRLLVPVLAEGYDALEKGKNIEIAFYLHNGYSITHRSAKIAIAKIPASTITTDTVREYLLTELKSLLPKNVSGLDIKLSTESDVIECYQYSHGLRKHKGNCQRIAHGDRSQIEIYIDDLQSEQWQEYWLKNWQDIYIGTRRHLVNDKYKNQNYHHFEYQAEQGKFFLKLPKANCYLIDAESTVENIAQHLAESIAAKEPDKKVRVKAFEGIGKGAIAECCLPKQ